MALNGITLAPDALARPIPLLFPNVSSIIDCPTKKGLAQAFHVSPSAVCKWEEAQRIPLRYLAPMLALMSWDTLCGPDLDQTIHVGRGYTRDERAACRNRHERGPILLQFRSEIDDVMDRIKIIIGSTEYKQIGRGLRADRNQIATWVKRRKIPDTIYHQIANQYAVSLSWLLTGSGDRQADPLRHPPQEEPRRAA